MDSVQFLNLALAAVGTLFSILMVLIGWMGNKIYNKLESLEEKLIKFEKEHYERFAVLDRRVTRLEALAEED